MGSDDNYIRTYFNTAIPTTSSYTFQSTNLTQSPATFIIFFMGVKSTNSVVYFCATQRYRERYWERGKYIERDAARATIKEATINGANQTTKQMQLGTQAGVMYLPNQRRHSWQQRFAIDVAPNPPNPSTHPPEKKTLFHLSIICTSGEQPRCNYFAASSSPKEKKNGP